MSPRTSIAKSNDQLLKRISFIATIFDIIYESYLKWLLGYCVPLDFLFYSLTTVSQSLLLVLPHFPEGVPSLVFSPPLGTSTFLVTSSTKKIIIYALLN